MKNDKKPATPAIQRIVAAVRYHQVKLVLTDADGTLYSFWDYFVPAMQQFVPYAAGVLGVTDLDSISREIGRVMNKYGTHEHPWTLEETWLRTKFTGSPAEFRERIVAPFWAMLDRYRTKYLRAYPDVRETLSALADAGIPVAIVSDAPAHMAIVRVTQTGLDDLIAGVYGLATDEPTADAGLTADDLAFGRERVRTFGNTPHNLTFFRTMPKNHEKPSPLGAQMAMRDFGITDASKVLFVGDSLKKDGGVAKAIGARYVWARYGINLPKAYQELIDVKFNPDPNATVGHVTYHPSILPPMVAQAAGYAEILHHLGRKGVRSTGTILPPSAMPQATKSVGH